MAEPQIHNALEGDHLFKFLTVSLAHIAAQKRVMFLNLFDFIFNLDVVTLLDLLGMFRIMKINKIAILLVYGAIFKSNMALFVI